MQVDAARVTIEGRDGRVRNPRTCNLSIHSGDFMTSAVSKLLKSGSSLFVLAIAIGGLSDAASAGSVLPGQGAFVAGTGAIAKSGGKMTIDQRSATGIIDWRSFSVGKANSVTFNNGHGATLNEVTGGVGSRIDGSLLATGSVYLINSSGVLVSRAGRIDTMGNFGASSASDSASFSNDKNFLSGRKPKADVINDGAIHSASGTVWLEGRNVSNAGSISSRDASLLASETTSVTGHITAHEHAGSGGHVETSGKSVNIAGAGIQARDWLIDPENLTVTASAASTIDSSLAKGTNVTLKTTATTTSGPGTASSGSGDILIESPISWKGTAALTLDAYYSVAIESSITAQSKGGLVIKTKDGGTAGDLLFRDGARIVFDSLSSPLTINGHPYTLENSIAGLASGIAGTPGGYFALANNITSSGTYASAPISTTFTGTFEGLGNIVSNLSIDDSTDNEVGLFLNIGAAGTVRDLNLANVYIVGLDARGGVGGIAAVTSGTLTADTVSGQVIGAKNGYTGGLVGNTENGSHVSGSTSSADVSGGATGRIGGLVGYNQGTVASSSSSGNINGGAGAFIGGLVGENDAAISTSSSSATVNADANVQAGGLVGYNNAGTVASSSASGTVNGGNGQTGYIGGLIGYTTGGSVTGSSASGAVSGDDQSDIGGLIGEDFGTTLSAVHASGAVNAGYDSTAGGLLGVAGSNGMNTVSITSVYATGNVTGGQESTVGGLIGSNGDPVSSSYASGTVVVGDSGYAGGLVGTNDAAISGSYATGAISGGGNSQVGGLVGNSAYAIDASYATGHVYGGAEGYAGGLVGFNSAAVTGSHASGTVIGYGYAGGLIGDNVGTGTTATSYATNSVIGWNGYAAGGLVGINYGMVSTSFATGAVTDDEGSGGGLVGYNLNYIGNSYALGSVSGAEADIGGLVGYNSTDGTIKSTYATGRLTGDSMSAVGGLIGDNENSTASDFSNDYWDTDTALATMGIGTGDSETAVKGQTTAQLKAGVPSGFNPAVWAESASMNGGLPYLKGVTPD